MIHVLHIHTLPIISGSGINTFLSMRGMDRSLYAVELAVAPGGPLIELVGQDGMKVHTFKHFVQPLNPSKDFLALLDLYVFLRRRGYHVIHTHNSKAGFIGRLAGKWARVPVIVHTVHGFAFHNQEPPWRQMLFRNLERLAAHWCDKMVFISQPLIDWAFTEGIAKNSKVTKVYSGIELDHFRPVSAGEKKAIRKKWGIRPRDPVVGIVSKLWEGKGHATLIHAFREIKREMAHAKLVIVGEGYLYEDLVAMVNRLGLKDSVLFTGFQRDVFEIMAAFDVAVLPSFFEGMGRVLLEAMAMEKPVVASRVGGIPDLVEDGINGFLVNPGKTRELGERLLKVLRDRKLARKMGKQGRKKTTDRFSAEIMVQAIDGIYRELLSAKGIPLYA
jgi:glycosyltransferase involved in cell wall biosynthesis